MFTEVGKKHRAPAFLFHPLVFDSPTPTSFDVTQDQKDGCELFCGHQYFIFGVINSEWQKGESNLLSKLIVSIHFKISKCLLELSNASPTCTDISEYNPLTPRSNQYINAPYNFNTLSSRQVIKIKEIIN